MPICSQQSGKSLDQNLDFLTENLNLISFENPLIFSPMFEYNEQFPNDSLLIFDSINLNENPITFLNNLEPFSASIESR